MKTKDVNVVFNNIQELAAFSEDFLYQLQSMLGGLIEGNKGEDSVGRLFLDSVCAFRSLYLCSVSRSLTFDISYR